MIIDLKSFIDRERPCWEELEGFVSRLEGQMARRLSLAEALRLHYLYERAAAGLVRINTFSSDPDVQRYLESLVARAYAAIHSGQRSGRRLRPLRWFFGTFPRTVRRHRGALVLSLAVTLVGGLFGGLAVAFDPEAKAVIMPFPHLQGDPSERVREEEARQAGGGSMGGAEAPFSTMLMTHNTKVSIGVMALGLTWGVGTILVLFFNGAMLGAVAVDYVRAGESTFLAGWLLPHGVVEIPAVVLAGQAGFVLAAALIGWGDRTGLKARMREVLPSVVTLIFGVAVLLVWAGLVEAFLSQYHEPVLPYGLKIAFGVVELALLGLFLGLAGRGGERGGGEEAPT